MVFRRFPSRWFQTALFLLCFACLESRAVRLDDEPMASLSSRRAIEGGDRVGRNTDPALSFSSHRFRTLHRGRFDPGGGAARTERTVFEIQDKAKEPGPYGVPLGTWVGIGFAILVLVVLCIVARIYIKQTVHYIEKCCEYSVRLLFLPVKWLYGGLKICWYPTKESFIFLYRKGKDYYEPWSVTS